jgi:hypothetical protein
MAASTKTCRLEPRVYGTAERVAEHYGVTIGGAVRMLILSQDVRRQFLTTEELGDAPRGNPAPNTSRPVIPMTRVSGYSIPSNQGGLMLRITR